MNQLTNRLTGRNRPVGSYQPNPDGATIRIDFETDLAAWVELRLSATDLRQMLAEVEDEMVKDIADGSYPGGPNDADEAKNQADKAWPQVALEEEEPDYE